MEHYVGLRPCREREMTRALAELPNLDGYKFLGVDEDGNRRRCVVRKGEDGIHRVYSAADFTQRLIGWQPYA